MHLEGKRECKIARRLYSVHFFLKHLVIFIWKSEREDRSFQLGGCCGRGGATSKAEASSESSKWAAGGQSIQVVSRCLSQAVSRSWMGHVSAGPCTGARLWCWHPRRRLCPLRHTSAQRVAVFDLSEKNPNLQINKETLSMRKENKKRSLNLPHVNWTVYQELGTRF